MAGLAGLRPGGYAGAQGVDCVVWNGAVAGGVLVFFRGEAGLVGGWF